MSPSPDPMPPTAAATPRLPGTDAPLEAGELVLLTDRKRRRYLVELTPGEEWHSHAGLIPHEELIGVVEGTAVMTSKRMEVVVLRPTRDDLILKMKRGAQVVYRKDQAMILAEADVRPGCHVVEAGAGSGALTMALLDAVGPEGSVTSFERREDHARIAVRNVERAFGGSPAHWQLHIGDLADELAALRANRVILDLLEPWRMVEATAEALPPGGIVLAYMPSVPQVMRFTDALWDDGRFTNVRTSETLVRGWDVDGLAVRPAHRMVAHTAFLTTARRVPSRTDGGPPPPRRKADTGGRIDWDAHDRSRVIAADEPASDETAPGRSVVDRT
ncbi:MAG: tRNA (adenine-N1)-methyltransferase [Nitriliruptoraceae bacterium]|nr:tRNA (adenine-N1)-methyltransferase [Nitriliruptoraceae bacterium]